MAPVGGSEGAPAGAVVVVVRAVLDPASATGATPGALAGTGPGIPLLVSLSLLWAGGACLVLLRWIREATRDPRRGALALADALPDLRDGVERALKESILSEFPSAASHALER